MSENIEQRQFADIEGLEQFWADVQTYLTRNYKELPSGMQFSRIYQQGGQLHILVEPFGGSTAARKLDSRTSLDVYSKAEVDSAIAENGGYQGQKTLYEMNHLSSEPHNGDSFNVQFGPDDSAYIDPSTGFGRIYNLWDGRQEHSYVEVLTGDNVIYDRKAQEHAWDRQTGNYKHKQHAVSESFQEYETLLDISQDENGEITVHTQTIPTATVSKLGLTTLKGVIGSIETDNSTAATPKAVRDAIDTTIGALDFNGVTLSRSETVGTISETDGVISVTKQDILVGESNIDAGAVTEGKIATGAITEGKIGSGAVTTGKIADDAVTSEKIAESAVTGEQLAVGAVTNDKIANSAVSTDKIENGAVTTGKLDDGAVTTAKLDDSAVTTGKLADDAVTEDKILDGSVTTDKIADNAVTTDKIPDGAITSDKLDAEGGIDGAVLKDRSVTGIKIAENTITGSSWDETTQSAHISNILPGTISGREIATGNNDGIDTANIVDHAVTSDKLHTDSVNTGHIVDGAVTTGKIYDGNVTTSKLADSAVTTAKIDNSAVTTAKIASRAVTTDKIDQQAVTTEKIEDLAVTTGKIADSNVTTAKIADSNVTTAKLADDAVTTAKIADGNVTTAKIDDSAVTTGKIEDSAVTTAKIEDSSITTAKIADGNVTTEKIKDDAITADKVKDGENLPVDISGTAAYASDVAQGSTLESKLNSKADKVTGATGGNLAGLDSSGNLTDSGYSPSSFKTVQTAVSDPSASGTSVSFIDTLSQDTNGEITATKKTVPTASTSVSGITQLTHDTVVSGALSDNDTRAVTPLGVSNAIGNLDSEDSKEETKVVRAVNVVNGKISVTKDQLGISDIDDLGTSLGNKADRVDGATSGNFAGLDSNGNLTDSGSKASDFVQQSDFEQTIQGLDLTEIGGNGYYVSTLSQTDGQVSATAVQMDSLPTENSTNAVTSGGVYSAIAGAVDALDVSDSAVANQFVTAVPEVDGKVSISRRQPVIADVSGLQAELNAKQNNLTFEGTYNAETNPVATVTSVTSRLNALDLSSAGGNAGDYVSQISQTDGQVSVTVSATADSVDSTSKVPVNGIAVSSAITGAIAGLDVTDISGFGAGKTLQTLSETDGKISATFQDIKVDTDNINNGAVTADKIAQDAVTTAKIADDAVTAAKVKDGELLPASITGNAATASAAQTGSDLETDLASKEEKSNKIQSMNSSSTGLTTEYPSAQAVVDFVNSSISTNTANFLGNKDVVTDLHLTTSATNQQIATALGAYVWPAGVTPTNNDYVFVTVDDLTTTGVDEYRRFKYDGSDWQYEYTLNNSSFTQAQWNAINSGLSASDKTAYDAHLADTTVHVTAADKASWNDKADKATAVTNVAYDSTNAKLTKTINGVTSDVVTLSTLKTAMSLDNVDNTADLDKPVSTATQTALDLKEDKSNKVTAWSATTTDTNYPSEKLVKGALDNKVDKVPGKGLSTNDYTTAEKNKLAGIETGAEVNQNAFSSVLVGTDTIQADTKTDTLTLVAGSNVQLSADTATDTVTISATDTTYGADRGISLVSGKFGHSNTAVTGASVGPSDTVTGVSVSVPRVTFDGYGHITAASDKTFTVRDGSTSQTGVVQLQGSIGASETENGKAATPKAVRDAINALDVSSVGGSGNIIVSISETDGKISATAGKLVASGGGLSYSGEIDEDFCLTLENVVFAD